MAADYTKKYLGDAVYATFDGHSIVLTLNDSFPQGRNDIFLEPGMVDALKEWRDGGYEDHNTGRKFGA